MPRHFPAHQGNNFRKRILSNCASASSLRSGFASWKGTLKSECAKSSSRNSQHCLKCCGTAALWTDAPCARQEQSPWQLPWQLPGAISCPSSAAGHHSLGAAARAVWGEQSQLDLWGWAGAGCCQQGDLTPALGDAWPGRRSSPEYPGGLDCWFYGVLWCKEGKSSVAVGYSG